jgi:type I restriction enzyme S subunit
MSKLEQLLEGVEVEWKTLGEVTNVLRGRRLTRDQLSSDKRFPVFHGGLEPLGYYEQKNRPANSVMIINVGASAGTVGYSDVDFWSSDGCYSIEQSEKLNNKFLYYFLIGEQHFLQSRVRKAGIPTLDAPVIEKIPIPIPCANDTEKSLKIQKEIVRILDTFTELTAELTAELKARKKQYNYYREHLLSFEEGEVVWKLLGQVVKVSRGRRLTRNMLTSNEKFPVFHGGLEPLGFYSKSNRPADSVMIINVGASAGTVGFSPVEFWSSDGCFCLEHSDALNNKFLYYYLIGEQHFIKSRVRVAGIPTLDNFVVENIQIPIPSLKEQERIVTILDKFDILTTSISEGLPKEIELRKKQYEYYRDMLLTFPKHEN